MKYKNGEEFLNSLYRNMHVEDEVMQHVEKSDIPTEKIDKNIDGKKSMESTGDADFSSLKKVEPLPNIRNIGGDLDFSSLENVEGLKNLQIGKGFDNSKLAELESMLGDLSKDSNGKDKNSVKKH